LKSERASGSVFSKPGEKGGWMYGCGFCRSGWSSVERIVYGYEQIAERLNARRSRC
jgi:hypothetical protein